MGRSTRAIESREYKVMLRAKRFCGGKNRVADAAARFRRKLSQAIASVEPSELALTGKKFKIRRTRKQATVEFFDTAAGHLQQANLVVRRRTPLNGGPAELTLKFRHRDRFVASAAEIEGDTKFEQDIKATHHESFISLYSLSRKETDVNHPLEYLGDIMKFFPSLDDVRQGKEELSNERLNLVGQFTAIQRLLEGPVIQLSQSVAAKCALILWYQRDRCGKQPVLAEFSFRYADRSGSGREPFVRDVSLRSYDILQQFRASESPVHKWVDLRSPTKTRYVYEK